MRNSSRISIALSGLAAILLAIAVPAVRASQPQPVPQVADAAGDAASVSGGGVTLHSVSVDLPDSDRSFPGGDAAEVMNNNCLACHSVEMVLTQPHLPRATWQGIVDKMRKVYKAPVAEEDVPAIVDYLAKLEPGS
jgi:hypothetical protein